MNNTSSETVTNIVVKVSQCSLSRMVPQCCKHAEAWLGRQPSHTPSTLCPAIELPFSGHEGSLTSCLGGHPQAELQTERQKTLLHDGAKSPLQSLPPGGRHDFIVSHDVKEVGPHTLVCSTSYTATDGEPKFMPQYFKFASHNPLSVRTKVSSGVDIWRGSGSVHACQCCKPYWVLSNLQPCVAPRVHGMWTAVTCRRCTRALALRTLAFNATPMLFQSPVAMLALLDM